MMTGNVAIKPSTLFHVVSCGMTYIGSPSPDIGKPGTFYMFLLYVCPTNNLLH